MLWLRTGESDVGSGCDWCLEWNCCCRCASGCGDNSGAGGWSQRSGCWSSIRSCISLAAPSSGWGTLSWLETVLTAWAANIAARALVASINAAASGSGNGSCGYEAADHCGFCDSAGLNVSCRVVLPVSSSTSVRGSTGSTALCLVVRISEASLASFAAELSVPATRIGTVAT